MRNKDLWVALFLIFHIVRSQLEISSFRVELTSFDRNFDKLESVIACDDYFPVIKDHIAVQFKQKHYKIIQEAKRTWLNMYMEAYEIKIEKNTHQSE